MVATLSTYKALAEEAVVRLYGKLWDIGVFFKMCKQHLKRANEIQIRDFDGTVAHTYVFTRYNIFSWFQRRRTDSRSLAVMQDARKTLETVLEAFMFTVMGIAVVCQDRLNGESLSFIEYEYRYTVWYHSSGISGNCDVRRTMGAIGHGCTPGIVHKTRRNRMSGNGRWHSLPVGYAERSLHIQLYNP